MKVSPRYAAYERGLKMWEESGPPFGSFGSFDLHVDEIELA